MKAKENLIWIDLEMTGLEPDRDQIIEMATIVTDNDLNILAEGPVIAIHHPQEVINQMDAWCTKTHGESGLIKRVEESTINLAEAEQATMDFLKIWCEQGKSPMCGNSICQDRRFLARWMPQLEAFFHYRNLDVSTLKELAKRWQPSILSGFVKQGSHLAQDDIRESIAELKYYRDNFIK